jgi:hypothetical protein
MCDDVNLHLCFIPFCQLIIFFNFLSNLVGAIYIWKEHVHKVTENAQKGIENGKIIASHVVDKTKRIVIDMTINTGWQHDKLNQKMCPPKIPFKNMIVFY